MSGLKRTCDDIIDLTETESTKNTKKTKMDMVAAAAIERQAIEDMSRIESEPMPEQRDFYDYFKDDLSKIETFESVVAKQYGVVEKQDPILFVFNLSGTMMKLQGDHPELRDVTGFLSGESLDFYTDDMHKNIEKTLKDSGLCFGRISKIDALYALGLRDAVEGSNYRATFVGHANF